jgi:hypothetical protein
MAFAAGVYTLPAGNPVVSGTTIQSSWANTTLSDIATALSTCVLKDGTQTMTANIPMASFKLTDLAAGSSANDSVRMAQLQGGSVSYLTGTTGTNTIVASGTPTVASLTTGQRFTFIPANTNTAATTLQVDSTSALSIFWNAVALVGGELRQNVPVTVLYDGTQYHLLSSSAMANTFAIPDTMRIQAAGDRTKQLFVSVTGISTGTTRTLTMPDENVTLAASTTLARGTIQLATTAEVLTGTDTVKAVTAAALQSGKSATGTAQVTTTGTTFDFTIPAWSKQITMTFVDVSLNGAGNLLVQLGDAGGPEVAGYTGVQGSGSAAAWDGTGLLSSGFELGNGAGAALSGSIIMTLHNSRELKFVGGYKTLSQVLTTVRLTRTAATFDGGGVNVFYI